MALTGDLPSLDKLISDYKAVPAKELAAASNAVERKLVEFRQKVAKPMYDLYLKVLTWINEKFWKSIRDIKFKCDTDAIKNIAKIWGSEGTNTNAEKLQGIEEALGLGWTVRTKIDLTTWQGDSAAAAQHEAGRIMMALKNEATNLPAMGAALLALATEFEVKWTDILSTAHWGFESLGVAVVTITEMAGAALTVAAAVATVIPIVIMLIVASFAAAWKQKEKEGKLKDAVSATKKVNAAEPNFVDKPEYPR